MQISSTFKPFIAAPVKHPSSTKSVGTPTTEASETFTFSEQKTSPALKAGKYALAAATTVGAGALAYFASNNVGTAATAAGVASGALAGATVLGTVGLFADLMGGIMGNSNHTKTAAIAGGVLGAGVGGAVGAFAQSPLTGVVMGLASGVSAFALTASATNILRP